MTPKYMNSLLVIVYILISGANPAFAGGDSRGGTGPRKKRTLSLDQIRVYLENTSEVKESLRLFFNGFSRKAREYRNPVEVQKLLTAFYENKPTIFERIDRLKFQIQTAPCLDNKNRPVAASIKHVPVDTACFSTEKTADDVDETDYRHQILGMAAHELTHLALKSDDEELPDYIQDYYVERVPQNGSGSRLSYAQLRDVQTALKTMTFQSPDEICLQLEKLFMQTHSFVERGRPGQWDDLSRVDLQGEILVEVILARAITTKQYCSKAIAAELEKAIFQNQDEVSATVIFQQSQYNWPVDPAIRLRRIPLGSVELLKSELAVLLQEVEQLMPQLIRY